jgi:DUF4097 and DUF4098 domain-containing protein YvlB
MRCFLLLLLPCLVGCANYTIVEHHDYPNLPAGDKPTVVVEMVNGPIKITTIPGKEIFARLTKRGVGRDKNEAEKEIQAMEFEVVPADGKITFRAKRTNGSKYWPSDSGAEATLQVPHGTKLDIATSNHDIIVEGSAGEVVAHNRNGVIKLGRITGTAQLMTSNAGIFVEQLGDSAKIETSNGKIITKGANTVLQCKTSNGEIRHTGSFAAGKSQLTNSNGNVIVLLPREPELKLEAATSNGRIRNDFGLKANKGSLKGTIGKGSTDKVLVIKNSNGNIEVKLDKNGKQTETVVVNDDDE